MQYFTKSIYYTKTKIERRILLEISYYKQGFKFEIHKILIQYGIYSL